MQKYDLIYKIESNCPQTKGTSIDGRKEECGLVLEDNQDLSEEIANIINGFYKKGYHIQFLAIIPY